MIGMCCTSSRHGVHATCVTDSILGLAIGFGQALYVADDAHPLFGGLHRSSNMHSATLDADPVMSNMAHGM